MNLKIYIYHINQRKTRASEARAKGLEPLAHDIFSQKQGSIISLVEDAVKQTGLQRDDVLQGARDIIAEWISEHAQVRKQLRYMFSKQAILASKVVKVKKPMLKNIRSILVFKNKLQIAFASYFSNDAW